MSNEEDKKGKPAVDPMFEATTGPVSSEDSQAKNETSKEPETTPTPEPPKEAKPVEQTVEAKPVKKKGKTYHSRRAEFGATVKQPKTIMENGRPVRTEPGKSFVFSNHMLHTEDPEIIDWIDKYIADPKRATDEVFAMPEVDPLFTGDVTARLDAMQLTELQGACRDREIEVKSVDDENSLRYKLLKFLSASGSKQNK